MVTQPVQVVKCIVCSSTRVDADDLCDSCDEPICIDCVIEANNNSGTIACSEDCLDQIYG